MIEPKGVIPQAAWRLDNCPQLLHPNEILLRVTRLNPDSTGLAQLRRRGGDIAEGLMEIVRQRGKLHNPETNSGGVLVGEVQEIGPGVGAAFASAVGDTVIPLVSTTAIPLHLAAVHAVDGEQIAVEGSAVMFAGMASTPLPEDFSLPLALAILDISSIVPQAYRHAGPGQTVLVIGAGKSGAAALAALRDAAPDAHLIVLDGARESLERVARLGFADTLLQADATRPQAVIEAVAGATDGALCDLVLNCVNVADTEASSIICARRGATVVFYSMATRFDKAALGTDATDNDVRLMIGNGIAEGQAERTLALFRRYPALVTHFEECIK